MLALAAQYEESTKRLLSTYDCILLFLELNKASFCCQVQSAYVAMPVSIPSDAGPAETFQELLPGSLAKSRVLRGHRTCIKPYILSMYANHVQYSIDIRAHLY